MFIHSFNFHIIKCTYICAFINGRIPMTFLYSALLIPCTQTIIMEYFSFYTNMEEYLAVALTDEIQYYSTTDRLIEAELFTVNEINHIFICSKNINEELDSDQCSFVTMAFHLRELIKKKLLNPSADHKLLVTTVLYSILDQSKFNEFKSQGNYLLYPEFYDVNGCLKVTREELLAPKLIFIDWKKLYGK